MSPNPAKPFLVSRGDDPQLQLLNEKIARLAGCKPAGDAFGTFALAAHLADLAIEAALELGQMPGVDMKALQPTVRFWKVVRDQSRDAGLACMGANHTLASALVALERTRLFKVSARDRNWEGAFLFAIISINTTAGPKEVMTLRLKDVDLESKHIEVQPEGAKNAHRIRSIPLNEEAFKAAQLAVDRAHKLGCTVP